MRKINWIALVALAGALLWTGGVVAGDPPAEATAEDSAADSAAAENTEAESATADSATVLKGEYLWTKRDVNGPVEAHFTSTGEGTFDVTFHFDFRKKARAWKGTAKGSLTDGDLSGEVRNENERRLFTFTGKVEGGTFTGTHAEIEDGKEFDTGTMTLTS